MLPDLGEGLTEATIVHWLVAEGDDVAVDQPIVEVETAKSVIEVPSPYAGTVLTLHAAEAETLEVGKPLISIETAARAGALTAATSGGLTAAASGGLTAATGAAPAPDAEQAGSGNVLVGYGTSVSDGPRRHRRRRTAVAAGAAAPAASVTAPAAVTPAGAAAFSPRERERRVPLDAFHKAASVALSRSRAEIPEATVWVDVDATPLWELRESLRTAADAGPGLLAFLARFVVAGLRAYPVFNARLDVEREEIIEYPQINLAIAVQGERGLVAPAVIDAGALSTRELDRAIRELTARARAGKVSPEELAAGTFTLNNYGSFRVDGSAAIINHPQVAILGVGRIIDRPWVVGGKLAVRKLTQLSFVFDHRVCDGAVAAAFMRVIADAIERPAAAIAAL